MDEKRELIINNAVLICTRGDGNPLKVQFNVSEVGANAIAPFFARLFSLTVQHEDVRSALFEKVFLLETWGKSRNLCVTIDIWGTGRDVLRAFGAGKKLKLRLSTEGK